MIHPSLLEECRALADKWTRKCREEWGTGVIDSKADDLRAILARHEHDDWRGWWKCDTCGFEAMRRNVQHYCIENTGTGNAIICPGRLLPFERRRAERRKP